LSALKLETSSGEVVRQCITATRRGGVVSIPGVYAGFIHAFLIGDAFDKGLTLAMGQTHVQKYLPELLNFIEEGKLQPDIIISHRMKLADAARGYEIFDKKEEDCRKVVLTP
jgi:threonine dehydrogenase-like Zn-dependent dehydrogenase